MKPSTYLAMQFLLGFRVFQNHWIHDIDGFTVRVSGDLVEYVRKLNFILVACDISDMRGAHDVIHCEQWMAGVESRLFLVDIDGGHAWTPELEGGNQCAGLDQRSATRID